MYIWFVVSKTFFLNKWKKKNQQASIKLIKSHTKIFTLIYKDSYFLNWMLFFWSIYPE